MYGNQILCDRVYGSVTQTNCFKHLYKSLYDNRPKDNSSIPTLRGFLESYSEKFKVLFFDNLSTKECHSFYHGLLKFDDFMDHICQIQDVSIEDCNTSKRECWKIFYLANKQEIRKINNKNLPDSVLYQLWLIYCKLDVKGELKVARTIFNEFIGKLLEKSDLKAPKPRNDPSLKSHLNFPTFLSIIQEQCLDKLPRDYAMVIVTEIYDTLFKGSLKQGYIYKMGKHMGSSRRWFMLTPDSLLYYDVKMRTNQTEPKGIIYISVYSNVRADGCSSKMDKFYFSLTCTRTKKKFSFYCDDATERQKWIKTINTAIASQAHQASIATLQRQDVEIGLEKWSFNYLLGLLDTLSPLNTDSPNMQSAARWKSTRELSADEISISNNRDDTLKRKSVDWGRPDVFTKTSVPTPTHKDPSIAPLVSPRPALRLVPRRPPACTRQVSGYMEMNIPDTATGYSSGYSSSNGSKSDEELDEFVVTPRFPEKNTMHIDIKQQKPRSPKVIVRRNSGYVDMHIPNPVKDVKQKVSFDIEHPLESIQEFDPIRTSSLGSNVPKGNVRGLIKKYGPPPVPEKKPRSLPSSPNPNSKLSVPNSNDYDRSDTPELSPLPNTVLFPVASKKLNTKDLIVSSSKFLNNARIKSKSQSDLILI